MMARKLQVGCKSRQMAGGLESRGHDLEFMGFRDLVSFMLQDHWKLQ
jgi:hypothetical protein